MLTNEPELSNSEKSNTGPYIFGNNLLQEILKSRIIKIGIFFQRLWIETIYYYYKCTVIKKKTRLDIFSNKILIFTVPGFYTISLKIFP